MPGTLTNPALSYFLEPHLIIVSDPQVDAQAVNEATNAGVPIIGIANTDNVTSELDLVIPANNRGRKSLATIYWLLANEILQEAIIKSQDQIEIWSKTHDIRKEMDYEERLNIVELMWEIVLVDEVLDVFESQLMRRVAGLLFVSDFDSGSCKKRAIAKLQNTSKLKN